MLITTTFGLSSPGCFGSSTMFSRIFFLVFLVQFLLMGAYAVVDQKSS